MARYLCSSVSICGCKRRFFASPRLCAIIFSSPFSRVFVYLRGIRPFDWADTQVRPYAMGCGSAAPGSCAYLWFQKAVLRVPASLRDYFFTSPFSRVFVYLQGIRPFDWADTQVRPYGWVAAPRDPVSRAVPGQALRPGFPPISLVGSVDFCDAEGSVFYRLNAGYPEVFF